jgi:hypothetical protein
VVVVVMVMVVMVVVVAVVVVVVVAVVVVVSEEEGRNLKSGAADCEHRRERDGGRGGEGTLSNISTAV